MTIKKPGLLVSIVGPTAVGKTEFAIQLSKHFQTEIISVDSRQFYKEMELGTAKPDAEELQSASHHFVNTLSIHEKYTAADFEREALQVLDHLFQIYPVVIAVGGSGLFFKALWEGLDDMPAVHEGIRDSLIKAFNSNGLNDLLAELKEKDPTYYEVVDIKNHQRVICALEVIRSSGQPFSAFRQNRSATKRPFNTLKLGLTMDRQQLFDRIDQRMDAMILNGLFQEAEMLYKWRHLNALQTVGYSEIFDFLDGKYDRDEAIRLLKRNSRRYAKRQITWFKKDEEIIWMNPDNLNQAISMIEMKMKD